MTLEAAMSYADSSSAHLKPVHMPKSAGLSFKPLLAVPVIVAVLTLTLATIMVLLLKPPAVGVDIVMPVASDNVHGAQLAQQIASEGSTPDNMLSGNITIAPMRVLPPFAPTCFVMHEERDNVRCDMDCAVMHAHSGVNTACNLKSKFHACMCVLSCFVS